MVTLITDFVIKALKYFFVASLQTLTLNFSPLQRLCANQQEDRDRWGAQKASGGQGAFVGCLVCPAEIAQKLSLCSPRESFAFFFF